MVNLDNHNTYSLFFLLLKILYFRGVAQKQFKFRFFPKLTLLDEEIDWGVRCIMKTKKLKENERGGEKRMENEKGGERMKRIKQGKREREKKGKNNK